MEELLRKIIVKTPQKFSLKDHKTGYTGKMGKAEAEKGLEKDKAALFKLQQVLYADNSYSVLILFQAMDAGGKDGAVSHVMSGLNPQGCQVFSFKQPSNEEYDHDFLWRHYNALPARGNIGIHNRSHYENVLICKVHPGLIQKEHIPGYDSERKIDGPFWKARYESIRNFEKHLAANGTVLIKFFLHISKEEQKRRFLERIEDPAKNWKFSSSDIAERELWHQYMKAYEDAIRETSAEEAPWYIIPADKKWFARYAISKVIIDTMKKLPLKYPVLPVNQKAGLAAIKKQLLSEK